MLSDFFIQAAGLAYHHDAVVYIIKVGLPTLYLITRQRAFYLRLDDIQHSVLMIYRRQAADDIQGLRLDLFTKVWYNKLTDK